VEFGRQVATGLRLVAVLLLPAGVGLAILAGPIAALLLGYGAAAGPGAGFVAVALRWFGLALLPFTVFQLLTRAFYARADTRTPMLANVAVNVVNVAGGLLAFGLLERPHERIAGLVVAWGASYLTGVAVLSFMLAGRVRAAFTGLGRALVTAVLASAVMATVLLGAAAAWAPPADMVASALRTLALVAVGIGVYLVTALLLGGRELTQLRAWLRR